MADNYLGRKMEEYEAQKCASVRTRRVSLVSLLAKNRSTRGFDASFKVRHDQLLSLIEAARLSPSAMNQQVLRYRLVTDEEAHLVLPHIRLGGALPELGLPLPGTEPNAFVVICTDKEGRYVDIDMGIATQTILLRAVEMGLNGVCIAAFDKEKVCEALQLPLTPQLIIAIGRSAERIEVVEIAEGENQRYYRNNGTHFVPKIKIEDLIIR
jgi:nitroreductase